MKDENAFSIECAENGKASPFVKKAYLEELEEFWKALSYAGKCSGFTLGQPLEIFSSDGDSLIYDLSEFHRKNGYGAFIGANAFEFSDGNLIPVVQPARVNLSDLKNYESEKAAIENNVRDFIAGLPYAHMLLYGDRGTGKSSTVHAVLNAYADKGLRLIELDKSDLTQIKNIKQSVSRLPLKFIIFIDDLSMSDKDANLSSLKAAVEGSVVDGNNVMIVATSNRRHVVKESFADRDSAVHPSDVKEEQLSLSDRFGLTVMFSTTDKACYLSIVNQLAKDRGVRTPSDVLEALAERWAVLNCGRSPRRAKQFIDFVYSCEQSGRKIDF